MLIDCSVLVIVCCQNGLVTVSAFNGLIVLGWFEGTPWGFQNL